MKQRWAARALGDLDHIRDHTRKHWGGAQTKRYLRAIQVAITAAARAPLQTAPADHFRPGYRKVAVGAHLIFFRIDGDMIEIIRILHGAMDIDDRGD